MTRAARLGALLAALAVCAGAYAGAPAQKADAPVLARGQIVITSLGLQPDPEHQVVPKNIATQVDVALVLPGAPPAGLLPEVPADALVFAELRGPAFGSAVALSARPNEPLKIPPLALSGLYFVENIRLATGGRTILQGTPDVVTIEVIDKVLVSQVTSRPLTAEEIQQKGIVVDQTNFDVINFTAAFGVEGKQVTIDFPMIIPKGGGGSIPAAPAPPSLPALQPAAALPPLAQLPQLQEAFQTPNVSISGLLLKIEDEEIERQFSLPPIPGVVIIPGNIAYLHQFFSVMLMVSNVAPGGSRLVVRDLTARIVLPAGSDTVPDTGDDPLRMALLGNPPAPQPKVQPVTQPGPDGKLGTADDIPTLAPGQGGDAEYLVEGRKEGAHTVQMQISGILDGLPVGPVKISGFATGIVEVRNPTFALTLSHPAIVTAGEAYDLLVTLTNTSDTPANFLSLGLAKRSISGAELLSDETVPIPTLAGRDSATVAFRLKARVTGTVTSTSFTSDDVPGKFELRTAVGALGIPMSPNTLVLPRTADNLPADVRGVGIGLLGQAFALATSPVTPKGLLPITQSIVYERATDLSQAGQRAGMLEPLASVARSLALDFSGNGFTRIGERFDTSQDAKRALVERDYRGFDELLRQSARGETFVQTLAGILAADLGARGTPAFLDAWAGAEASRPPHIVALTGSTGGGAAPVVLGLTSPAGKRLGQAGAGAAVARDVPYGNMLTLIDENPVFAQAALVAVPESGAYTVEVTGTAAGVFDLGLIVPEGSALRRLSYASVPITADAKGRVSFSLGGANDYELALDDNHDGQVDRRVPPGVSAIVQDAGPFLVSAIQVVSGRPDLSQFGQLLGLLFSEEISKMSSQSDLDASALTHYGVEGNQVLGASLQPGGRVVLLGLRDGIGPLVPRTATVTGTEDRLGHRMDPEIVTVPIVPTIKAPGGSISGQVRRGDGTPVPNARLRFSQVAPVPVATGALAGLGDLAAEREVTVTVKDTDASGRYGFDYVRIFNLSNEFVKFEAVDTESGERGSVTTHLGSDRQHLDLDIILLGTGRLVGRALAPDGTPLPGAVVRVTSLTRFGEGAGAVADGSGAFSIFGIPVGNITVEAAHVPTNSKVLVASSIPAAGATVVQDLTLLPVAEIELKTGTLKGQVFRSDGATTAAAIPVFTDRGGFATTDATGSYRIEGLPEGQVTVRAIDQTLLQQGTVVAAIAGGGETTANLLLFGGTGTVRGVVQDADGTPVAGAVVGGGLALVRTGPSGEFVLPDVPLGQRTITALDEARELPGSVGVNLTTPGEDVHVLIVLEARGTIAGRVFESNGTTPVPGLKVFLVGPRNLIAFTDANGGYRFGPVPVGAYGVSAFRSDFSDGNFVKFKLVFKDEVRTANVVFRGKGAVQGIVQNAAGTAGLGARVGLNELQVRIGVLRPPENLQCLGDIEVGDVKLELPKCETVGLGFQTVPLNRLIDNDTASGTFTFDNVFVGDFTVQAANSFSPIIVTAGGTIQKPGDVAQVVLRLVETSVIEGTVFQPDGRTAAGQDVVVAFNCPEVVQDPGKCPFNVVTDEHGRFRFPLVNAGSFSLTTADPASGLVGQSSGAVDPGRTAEIPVRLLGLGTVAVTVSGSNGPIEGAGVTLRQGSFPGIVRSGQTDAGGVLAFEGGDAVTEGPFSVTAFDPRTGVTGFNSGAILAPDGHADVLVVLPDESGTVRGRFLKSDGATGIPNAQVVLSSSGRQAFATTNAAGGFVFEGVLKGPFTLEAFDSTTARRGRSNGQIGQNHDDVTADIVEVPQGSVKGFVRLAKDGSPVAGADVTLSVSSVFGQRLMTTSGVDGSFSLPAVSAGTFTVQAVAPVTGLAGSASGSLSSEGEEARVDVAIVIPATGRVEGFVTKADGGPAIGAQVFLGGRATTVDDTGAFLFDGVPLGPFALLAVPQIGPDGGTGSGQIAFDGDVERADIRFIGTGRVTGTVRNGAGQAVPFAAVELVRKSSVPRPFSTEKTADENGVFTFDPVPVGDVSVAARDTLTGLAGSASGTLASDGAVLDLAVVLEPSGDVRGRVVREVGSAPASGMALELVDGSSRFGSTAGDGTFRFNGLALSIYRLTATDPLGEGIARVTAILEAQGQIVDLGDIVLDESPPRVLSITPSDGSASVPVGQPIVVRFSEPVDPSTINPAGLPVSGAAGAIAGAWALNADRTTATFTPATAYRDFARISVKVTKAVLDRVGKALVAEAISSFTTADSTPPVIVRSSPAAGARDVPLESVVRISYSEKIDPPRFAGPAIVVTRGGMPIGGRIDFILNNTVAVFTPDPPLRVNGTYQVNVLPAADIFGNTQAQGLAFAFSTLDTEAPALATLVAPGGTTVPVGATAKVVADAGTTPDVAFVEFFIDGALVATDATAPFELDLPISDALGSTVVVTARATDLSGNAGALLTLTLQVQPDALPSVSILSPASGGTVNNGALVTVTTRATDDRGVAQVLFQAAGAATSTQADTVDPPTPVRDSTFVFAVPPDAVPGSAVTLKVIAVDTGGQRSAVASITLTVDDLVPPTVRITSPPDGSRVGPGDTIGVVVAAQDNGTIATVRLLATGAATFSETRTLSPPPRSAEITFQVPIPATAAMNSTITLRARAQDGVGNATETAPVTLVVRRLSPPTVSLTTPVGGTSVVEGSTLTLGADADDDLGVVQVEFFMDGVSVGVDSDEPYQVSRVLGGGAGGTSVPIEAVAIDADGLAARDAVTITRLDDTVAPAVALAAPADGARLPAGPGDVALVIDVTSGASSGGDVDGDGTVDSVLKVEIAVARALLGLLDPALSRVAVVRVADTGAFLVQPLTGDDASIEGALDTLLASGPSGGAPDFAAALRAATDEVTGTRSRREALPVQFLLSKGSGTLPSAEIARAADGGVIVHTLAAGSGADPSVLKQIAEGTGGIPVALPDPGQMSAVLGDRFFPGSSLLSIVADASDNVAVRRVVFSVHSADGTIDSSYTVEAAPFRALLPLPAVASATDVTIVARAIDYGDNQTVSGPVTVTLLPNDTVPKIVRLEPASGPIGRDIALVGRFFDPVAGNDAVTFNGVPATVTSAGKIRLTATVPPGATDGPVKVVTGGGASNEVPFTVEIPQVGSSLSGRVLDPVGQAGVEGVTVRLTGQSLPFNAQVTSGPDGAFRFENLAAGTYELIAFGANGRIRARDSGIVVPGGGQAVNRDLRLIALGIVRGQVLTPDGTPDPGLYVVLRSDNPIAGGYFATYADGDARFEFTDVPAGPFTVSTGDAAQQLLGEAYGRIDQDGQVVVADIHLLNNAISLPVTLKDVNELQYDVQPDGSLAYGYASVFAGDSGARRGALILDLVADGSAVRFTGTSVGTVEDAGREVATRQQGVAVLDVTRKIFVPRDGYFTRYLETLSNPTDQPITVDVRVTSHVGTSGRSTTLIATSSGDAALDVSNPSAPDRWLVVDDNNDLDPFETYNLPSVSFVFDGAGGAQRAAAASFVAGSVASDVSCQWSGVTIPPGGAVSFLHFGVQQLTRAAAQAAAERLVQLPPEALAGLGPDEIARVRNFAVPADGQSGVPPLPRLDGKISGRLLALDGSTPVVDPQITIKSRSVLFGRTYYTYPADDGSFSLAGFLGQYSSIAVPVDGFILVAYDYDTRATITREGGFPGPGTFTGNLAFLLGAATASSSQNYLPPVQAIDGDLNTSWSAAYPDAANLGGAPFVEVSLPVDALVTQVNVRGNRQGLAGGHDILRGRMELFDASGQTLDSEEVDLPDPAHDAELDVPDRQGVRRLRFTSLEDLSSNPGLSEIEVIGTATSAAPANGTRLDAAFTNTGMIKGTVRRNGGAPVTTGYVYADNRSLNVFKYGDIGPDGGYAIVNLPAATWNVTAQVSHPQGTALLSTTVVTVKVGQVTTLDIVMPPTGEVVGTVRDGGGTPAAGVNVKVAGTGFQRQTTTDDSGHFDLTDVPAGAATLTAIEPLTQVPSSATVTVVQDQTTTQDLMLVGLGTVQVQVTYDNGSPGSQVQVNIRDGRISPIRFAGYTDFGGNLTICCVTVGDFIVEAHRPDLFEVFTQVTSTVPAHGAVVPVAIVLPGLGIVTGHVTFTSGAPAANATVQLSGTNVPSKSTRTDSNGDYTFVKVPTGRPFNIRAYAPSRFDRYRDVPDNVIPADGATLTVNVVLPAAATVRVTVLKADGTPLPGAIIEEKDSDSAYYVNAGTTDANGVRSIPDVPEGTVTVRALAPPTYSFAGSTVFTIAPTDDGKTIDVTIGAPLIGNVRGTVFAADGRTPVPNAYVLVSASEYAENSTYTDTSGFYQFSGVAAGSEGFEVKAYAPQYSSLTARAVGTFTANGDTVTIDVTLPVSVVEGHVRFTDGVPVAGASFFGTAVVSGYEQTFFYGQTDPAGSYRAFGAPVGSFKVTVQDGPSGLSGVATGTVTDLAVPVVLDVFMQPSGTVTGKVLDGGGAPVPDAPVVLTSSALSFDHFGTTDSQGAFSFVHVPLGAFTLQAQQPATGITGTASGALADDRQVVVIDVNLPATVAVTGTIYQAGGTAPIPGAMVTLEALDNTGPLGSFTTEVTADASGAYQATGIPLGRTRITGRDPAKPGIEGVVEVTLTVGGPFVIDVIFGNLFGFDDGNNVFNLDGDDGFRYDVVCNGALLNGGTTDGSLTTAWIIEAYALFADGRRSDCFDSAPIQSGGREILLGPGTQGSLSVTRRVFVPQAGRFVRFLDILTNHATSSFSGEIEIFGFLGALGSTRVVVDPSATGDTFAVTDGGGACCTPALAHVFSGPDPPESIYETEFNDGSYFFSYSWYVDIPVGGTVVLLHFAAQRDFSDAAGAEAEAHALVDLSDPDALFGLSAAEKSMIINFNVP